MKPIKLGAYEDVIAVVPDRRSGPGWATRLVTVYVYDYQSKVLRDVCIQQENWTPELRTLFTAGDAMHQSLMAAIPTKKAKPCKS